MFLNNFVTLYGNLKKDNPFAVFFAGDFNGYSQLWWSDGDTTAEGKAIEQLTSQLGLNQLLEPTNFEPNKTPSCIDLIFTDQYNCVLESGSRASLDNSSPNNVLPHEFPNTPLQHLKGKSGVR